MSTPTSGGAVPAVLDRLDGVRPSGEGWIARCPAHDDSQQSLSIGQGENGRLLLHCHAGCAYEAILAGLDTPRQAPQTAPNGGKARVIVTYDYKDEDGVLLYQVVRFQPKGFRQRGPDGLGGWTWTVNGVRRVLYRLPDLKGKPDLNGKRAVVIVEGEKDAERLWKERVIATTNAGGAGKWLDEYAEQLKRAGVQMVVILPDNDEPGEEHARKVAQSCLEHGLGVKIVRLPDLAPKGDVSDWLDAGHTRDELLMLAKKTPEESRPEQASAAPPATEPLRVPEEGMIGLAREFADLYAEYLESPRSFFYFAFLTYLGAILSQTVTIASELGVPEPVNKNETAGDRV